MLVIKEALSAQALVCLEQLKALDLSPIGAYLMNPKNGYSWTRQQTFQAINRYKTFLFVSYLYPQVFLVSTQEIDCVWHCHILHTRKYRQDCIMLFNNFIDHEPETERSDEVNSPNIEAAFAQTQALLALFEGYFNNTASPAVSEGTGNGQRRRVLGEDFSPSKVPATYRGGDSYSQENQRLENEELQTEKSFRSLFPVSCSHCVELHPAIDASKDYSTLHPTACGRPLTKL
ncbi:MAG: glycine-rich domain-containing protein-like [Cyanobacteriota bacterium]